VYPSVCIQAPFTSEQELQVLSHDPTQFTTVSVLGVGGPGVGGGEGSAENNATNHATIAETTDKILSKNPIANLYIFKNKII